MAKIRFKTYTLLARVRVASEADGPEDSVRDGLFAIAVLRGHLADRDPHEAFVESGRPSGPSGVLDLEVAAIERDAPSTYSASMSPRRALAELVLPRPGLGDGALAALGGGEGVAEVVRQAAFVAMGEHGGETIRGAGGRELARRIAELVVARLGAIAEDPDGARPCP